MSGLFAILEKYIMGPMTRMSSRQFVRAIMAAGISSVPFTIVGSAFLIFNVLPQAFPVLAPFWESTFFKYSNLYMIGNWFTMGVLALYFNLSMGYELTELKAEDFDLPLSPINGALLGMMAFLFTMVELSIQDGTVVFRQADNMINGVTYGNFATRLGTSGIFAGIVMACLAVWIYKVCIQKGWAIRLPDAVPAGVSRSFTALIPCFLVAFAVILINGVLVVFGYDIYTILAVPFGFVGSIAGSWYGVLIIELIIHLLWSVGIHGANIMNSIYTPIVLANLEHNIGVMNGVGGSYEVFAGSFQAMFVILGGSGATLGFTIWMCFMAKSEQLSLLGKAAIGPALFNINEPVIFGVPIIYNPNLVIPFILAPCVCSMIAYFLLYTGIFPPVIALIPWPTPGILGGFLGTASLSGAFLAAVNILISFLIYYPFARNYDRLLLSQEQRSIVSD